MDDMELRRGRARRPMRLLTLLLCAALPRMATGGELEPARIGLTREASIAPLLLAVEAGYFKDEGLDAQLVFFKTDTSVSAAVASGKVDIGLASLSAPFYGFAATHDLKFIASRSSDQTGFPMYALLVSKKAHDAGLTGVSGLPNARIGVASPDSGPYYGLLSIAARFKLDPLSVKRTTLQSTRGQLSALSRGSIDAALLPFPIALQSTTERRSLLRLSDFVQWQEGVVFATGKTISTKRELIERFMRAYQRGTMDYQLNFLNYDDGGDFIPGPNYERYLGAFSRQLGISAATLAQTKTYCDRRANLNVADITRQVEFWKEEGRLEKETAAPDVLDLSFIGEETPLPRIPMHGGHP
jgi:NitT/TauT family transport system substrate-binding protein